MNNAQMIHLDVNIRGWVQGVGFRQKTLEIARRHPVTGYVRNLPNGTVEIVVEGESDSVGAFLAEVGRRMAGHVESMDRRPAPVVGAFTGFEIQY